jgi:hypothetical protein
MFDDAQEYSTPFEIEEFTILKRVVFIIETEIHKARNITLPSSSPSFFTSAPNEIDQLQKLLINNLPRELLEDIRRANALQTSSSTSSRAPRVK